MENDGKGHALIVGVFSSHWAACAAMIRTHQPDFKSLRGDEPDDLTEEAAMKTRCAFLEKHGRLKRVGDAED